MKQVLLSLLVVLAGEIKPYFSPEGGGQQAIINEINKANKQILVEAYSFTAKPIEQALFNARLRGCDLKVILDKSQSNGLGSVTQDLIKNNVETYIDGKHSIMHKKVMIIDNSVLILGSYNFTNNAEHNNAEDVNVISNELELVQKYIDNFNIHKNHSVKVR